MDCQEGSNPGFKFGDSGKCFTYRAGDLTDRDRARKKAEEQGRAIASTSAVEKRKKKGADY